MLLARHSREASFLGVTFALPQHKRAATGERMYKQLTTITKALFLAGLLASSMMISTAFAQSAAKSSASAAKPPVAAVPFRYQPNRFAGRAGKYYELVWGVDSLNVKAVESGEIIRFTYRVLDAEKAKVLNDKKLEPSLIDPQAGVSLVVPSLEQVGILRQGGTPETGKFYWMAFSNSGRRVKRGDHVDVVIGHFRAKGLVVD
jgi:hypothetical protein